jgi:choice-of-anchor C domain-containing protein
MTKSVVLLASVLLFTPSLPQQGASLIVNGSFEEGPTVRTFLNLPKGDTSVRGWVVTGEGVDYVSTGYWLSSDGARAIDLDGSARSAATPPYVQGGIAQTFATTAGTRYRVTFDLAGNPNQLPRVKPMRITAAGESREFTFDTTGRTGATMGWTPRTWTFTATAASTTLEFRSLTVSPQTGYGAAIDNVAVVPEPPAPLEVKESEKEIQVSLGSEILFDTGRFDLKPAATTTLESLRTLLSRYPNAPILIEGHTDNVGTDALNQVLSEQRAAAVKAWLVTRGITAALITTRGRGETSPIAPNDTPAGRQKNRRVDIRIQK